MNYLLIGKPNVGKSSIYNILTGHNSSIVHSDSGTTRDWHKQLIKNSSCYIYDTPGVLINDKKNADILNFNSNQFVDKNIDVFFYVVDYKHDFNDIDSFAIKKLRKFNKKIILIINKFDNYKQIPNNNFSKYGIDELIYISCSHRFGIELLNSMINKSSLSAEDKNHNFSIAIFGKPNVGKSTLLNTMLGYKRSLTSPIAGTTSDFVVDTLDYKNKIFKLIDTAGIGKKANIIDKSINFYSIKKSFENIKSVDSTIVIIDSNEGLDRQDKRIIKLVSSKSKSIILIFNKLDLIIDKELFKSNTIDDIKFDLSEVKNIKIFFISALIKSNVIKILEYLYSSVLLNNYKISTSKLNIWLKKVVSDNQHPLIENKRVNFKYIVQVKEKPVTIKIFCSYASKLKSNYKRYLTNNFNYHFKILNQKTKIIFSSSKNPYV
jgi:GTP-binding protein